MKALVYLGPGRMELRDLPEADPGPEEARVRAALLLVQIDRFLYFWIVNGITFDRERALGTLTDLWLSMLGLSQTQSPRDVGGQVDSSLDIA